MRLIIAWIIALVLLAGGVACIVEALTTSHSVWLSIPLLVFSGALIGPAIVMLLALAGSYVFVLEVNGHRLEFRRKGNGTGD